MESPPLMHETAHAQHEERVARALSAYTGQPRRARRPVRRLLAGLASMSARRTAGPAVRAPVAP
jgi:hypothetical protein